MVTQSNREFPAKMEEPPAGMPATVTLLRDHGRKVTRAEMLAAPALVGLLRIEDTWMSDGRVTRYYKQAVLHAELGSGKPSVVQPLFEPIVARLDHAGLVLSGHELNLVDGVVVQHVQVWLVQLAGCALPIGK